MDTTLASNGVGIDHSQQSKVSVKNDATFELSPVTPSKRKMEDDAAVEPVRNGNDKRKQRGAAPIKPEYLINTEVDSRSIAPRDPRDAPDDDAAEAFHHKDRQPDSHNKKQKRRDKNQGQNKARTFGTSRDEVGLCSTRVKRNEFSPEECRFGSKCKFEHDLRRYLRQHKRQDLDTFNSRCPVYQVRGRCAAGWKCRFANSHVSTPQNPCLCGFAVQGSRNNVSVSRRRNLWCAPGPLHLCWLPRYMF